MNWLDKLIMKVAAGIAVTHATRGGPEYLLEHVRKEARERFFEDNGPTINNWLHEKLEASYEYKGEDNSHHMRVA